MKVVLKGWINVDEFFIDERIDYNTSKVLIEFETWETIVDFCYFSLK